MKRLFLILVSLVFLGGSAYAADNLADLKISVIDLHQILQEAPQAKKISDKLRKQFKPRQVKITQAQTSLKKELEKLKRDDSIMSASEKSKLEQHILADKRELQRKEEDYQQDLNEIQNSEMQALLRNVREVVNTLAKKEGFDLILQKDSVPFASARVDITPRVLKALKA